MTRHLRTPWTMLALTFALTVAMTAAASAQTGAAPGAAGSSTAAGTSEKLTMEKRTAEPAATADPAPFNILDRASEDMYRSLLGWSSKYRIGLDVQDGDWVRYESVGDGPKETLEISLSKTDAGEMWIVEKRKVAGSSGSREFHALFSAGKPKLLQAFIIDESGAREDVTPLDDMTAGTLFLEARAIALEALGGDRNKIRVSDCGDVLELTGPYGTLVCRCLEVQVAEEVDPISFATRRRWLSEGTLVWLNEDVPRLIPMSSILLPALLSPDDMMVVRGGMVRSPYHVLVDYKGRK